jgi:hypothetical protein
MAAMEQVAVAHLVPFILYGRGLSAERRSAFRTGALDRSLGLLVVWDGTVEVEPPSGPGWRLRAGEAGLLDAGSGLVLGARVHAGLILLDLLPRPHARNRRAHAWHPTDDQTHPPWRAVLGAPVPMTAPAHLRAQAVETITAALASYWRSSMAELEARMRLGLLAVA